MIISNFVMAQLMTRLGWEIKGYLTALGQGRTAEVKRDARIGEANAKSDVDLQLIKKKNIQNY